MFLSHIAYNILISLWINFCAKVDPRTLYKSVILTATKFPVTSSYPKTTLAYYPSPNKFCIPKAYLSIL